MGKTKYLFKKISDTKGTFHAKIDTIKDRNGMYLIEDIKKRWQEYTAELFKKDLHDPDNRDGVVAHLEPDILENEVKWALETAEKRREAKGKGEKEKYIHLNAEFQRLPRRDKKAFLSDQCKEIEENNRIGKIEIFSRKLVIPREHFMERRAR